MNVLRIIRFIVAISAIVYGYLHVSSHCPINAPLVATDPLCRSVHYSYSYIANSPVYPYIVKVSDFADKSIHPHLSSIKESVQSYREEHEQYVIDQTYKTASTIISSTTDFVQSTIWPISSSCIKSIYNSSKILFIKFKYLSFVNYNIYVKPYIVKLFNYIAKTPIGEYSFKLLNSSYVQTVFKYTSISYNYISSIFSYIHSKLNEIYQNFTFKGSDSYRLVQLKQNFLKDYLTFNGGSTTSTESTEPSSDSSSSVASASLFDKYDKLVQSIVESANNDFKSESNQLSTNYLNKLQTQFHPLMKSFSKEVNTGYENIHAMISNINNPDADHVSREAFRNALSDKHNSANKHVELIEKEIESIIESYTKDIYNIRIAILDTLEEFADSSLLNYSNEITANGDDWSEWKKFKNLKFKIINFRDSLIDTKPNEEFQSAINKLKSEVQLLVNESGSYLAILRAKANIEFQAREAQEAQLLKDQELKQDNDDDELHEEEVSTITQTRFVTETINDPITSSSTPEADSDAIKVVIQSDE